jgi:hypothetical protein
MELRNLPYLPSMMVRSTVLKASEIMDVNFPILSTTSKMSDLRAVLADCEAEKNRFDNSLNIEVAFVDEKKRFLGMSFRIFHRVFLLNS